MTAAAEEHEPQTEPQSPNDRATTFQAVKGEPEHYSGEKLLVGAYSLVWVLLLAWVGLVWRKQSSMAQRLDDLERVLAEAAATRANASERRPAP
jgi:uncharacterized protein HemX